MDDFLKNVTQTIPQDVKGFLGGVGNVVNQGVQGVEHMFQPQPPIQSPIPQSQSMVPQPNPVQNILSGAGNFIGQQVQNAVENKNALGQPNTMPFGLNNPFAPAPRVNISNQINTGNPIRDFLLKTAVGIPESVLNAPSDIQKAVPKDVQDFIGGKLANPGTAIQDVAQTAMPIATLATLGGGTLAKDIAENVGKEAGTEALGQAIKEGAISGAKYGGAFGILQGLAGSNQIPQQLIGAAQQGLIGAGVGTFLGGATGGIANRLGAIKNSLAGQLQQKYGMDQQTAQDAVTQFARDELGRFTGGTEKLSNGTGGVAAGVRSKLGISQGEPVFYGDLRQSLGLPREGNYQAGFIKPDEFIPGMKKTNPEAEPPSEKGEQAITMDDVANYAPQLTTAKGINKVQRVLDNAENLKPSFDQDLQAIADDNGADFKSRIKSMDSSLRKITQQRMEGKTDYNEKGLNDPYGARIVIQDIKDEPAVIKDINETAKDGQFEILKSQPVDKETYHAYHVDIQKRLPDGKYVRGEIQIHTPQSLAEAVKNHPIRSVFGENPPEQIDEMKKANAEQAKNLTNDEAMQATDILEQKHKAIGDVASLKDELSQPPLPPKMSSKAIKEGLEAPITGRDISVSPQAAQRFNAQGLQPIPFEQEMDRISQLPADHPMYKTKSEDLPPKEGVPTNVKPKENPIKVTNPNATVQDARRAMDTAQTQILQRGRIVQKLISDAIDQSNKEGIEDHPTNYGENRLFRQAIEHPGQEKEILTQVKNPTKFKQALDAFRDFTRYNLQASQDAGSGLKGVRGYYSHEWDLSKPEDLERYNQLMQAKANNFKGWFNKERVFKNIEEGEAKGFHLKNENVANDVADYTNAFTKEQGARVLSNRLVADFPTQATVVNGEGAPANLVQSGIPGAKGLYTTPEIKAQLADLEPQQKSGFVNFINGINNLDKEVRLSGGLFHVQNTGMDYLASNLGFARFPRLATAAKVFLSPSSYLNYMKDTIDSGLLDKMAKANITLDSEQDIAGTSNALKKAASVLDKLNPLSQLNKATFGRLMNFFKVEAFKALDNRGLIDTETPEGIKVAQGYGREINNMFGGQNRVVGDDIFKSQTDRTLSHLGILAPDYQQGRFKRTLSALGIGDGSGANPLKRNAANNYAAYTLALRVGLTAAVAEIARRAITGKFNPNLIAAIQNDVLDPNFPTPWQNTSTNGTKENEVAHLPASNVSDIFRGIQDPAHFLISHTGAGLSDYVSFAGNQDYFGNKLSDTNNSVEKLLKIGLNDVPIPFVQGQKVISGQVAPGNALLNELGDRVSLDPNDPTALYFKAQGNAFQNLLNQTSDPKTRNDLQGAYALLQNLSAIDPNNPNKKMLEYQTYSTFPQLFNVMKQAALAQAGSDQSKIDPIYQDKYSAIMPYFLRYETLPPKDAFAKQLLQDHPEISKLIADRQAFFLAHPIAQGKNAIPYDAGPQASAYVQQQLAAKNYNDPQVQDYLNQRTKYDNQKLQQLNLSPVNSFGQLPFQATSANASFQKRQMSSFARSMRNNAKYSARSGNNKVKDLIGKMGGNYEKSYKKPISLGSRSVSLKIGPHKGLGINLPKQAKSSVASSSKSKALAVKYQKPKKQNVKLA